MAWTLEYEPSARKQLRKLDKAAGARVLAGLEQIAALDDPRLRGKGLTGNRSGYWRWRFGDYRVIARRGPGCGDRRHRGWPPARDL